MKLINKEYLLKIKLSGENNENAYEEIMAFDNLKEIYEYVKNIPVGFEFETEPYYF